MREHRLHLAVVAGLSDKKLAQKLAPLQEMDEVAEIDLFRRLPFCGPKVRWQRPPAAARRSAVLHEPWRLAALLARAARYDAIVACHQRFHGVAAALAGRLRRRPVVQVVTTDVDWIQQRPALRWALATSASIGVRGPRSRDRLRELGHERPIEILANPFEPGPTPPGASGGKQYDLLAVGDCALEKDYPWMLQVLARITRERPGIRLAIAGGGPFETRLGAAIERHSLRGNVVFLGRLDETGLSRAHSSSRALLLTSSVEGLPMAVLEAMAAGLPVFVTGVGELPWLVTDGREGRVVAHGDTEGMARSVLGALGEPARLSEMAVRARERAVELARESSLAAIQNAWRTLFSACLSGRPGVVYPRTR